MKGKGIHRHNKYMRMAKEGGKEERQGEGSKRSVCCCVCFVGWGGCVWVSWQRKGKREGKHVPCRLIHRACPPAHHPSKKEAIRAYGPNTCLWLCSRNVSCCFLSSSSFSSSASASASSYCIPYSRASSCAFFLPVPACRTNSFSFNLSTPTHPPTYPLATSRQTRPKNPR